MLRSSSELLGSELQALLSPYKSAACWRESPLLRSFEVKNSELWLQMGPASAVCGELGLPSLERGFAFWEKCRHDLHFWTRWMHVAKTQCSTDRVVAYQLWRNLNTRNPGGGGKSEENFAMFRGREKTA